MRPKDSIHSFTAPVRNKGKSQTQLGDWVVLLKLSEILIVTLI